MAGRAVAQASFSRPLPLQLLYHAGRPLHHLAGGDEVGHMGVEDMDVRHGGHLLKNQNFFFCGRSAVLRFVLLFRLRASSFLRAQKGTKDALKNRMVLKDLLSW